MATKIKHETHTAGGLEETLDLFAFLCLVTGGLISMILLAMGLHLGIIPAAIVTGVAILIWLVLRSLSEIIRLQKKRAGIPFSGQISGGKQTIVFKCSECRAILHSESRCDACGETIEQTA